MNQIQTLDFEILGIPMAKQSAHFKTVSGFIKSYQPEKIVNNKHSIAMQIRSQLPHDFIPISGIVTIEKLYFVFPPKSNLNKREKQIISDGYYLPKTTKPDLDNIQKQFFDSLQGILFMNDAQVCNIKNMMKCYGNRPGIYFTLRINEDFIDGRKQ